MKSLHEKFKIDVKLTTIDKDLFWDVYAYINEMDELINEITDIIEYTLHRKEE